MMDRQMAFSDFISDTDTIGDAYTFIKAIFSYSVEKNPHDEDVIETQEGTVLDSLSAFFKKDHYLRFSFSLCQRKAEEYLSIKLGDECLEISEGGTVTDESGQAHSYKAREFRLWNQYLDCPLDFSYIRDMIDHGARIEFDYPLELTDQYIRSQTERDEELELYQNLTDSYEILMSHLAPPILKKYVDQTIQELQSYGRKSGMMLLEDDECLNNVWEELCVQEQRDFSIFYDEYLDFIESVIKQQLKSAPEDEKIILWTQTDEYEEWKSSDAERAESNDILRDEYFPSAIRQYILSAVRDEATDFKNEQIERFLYPEEFETDKEDEE